MKLSSLQVAVVWVAAGAAVGMLPGAQANGISGPVSGFVVDGRSQRLRPINGLPGSAVLGTAVQLPFSAGLAAAATDLDYAIVTDAHGTGEPFLARGLASGAPTVAPLAGAVSATVGGTLSTVTLSEAVAEFPAAS